MVWSDLGLSDTLRFSFVLIFILKNIKRQFISIRGVSLVAHIDSSTSFCTTSMTWRFSLHKLWTKEKRRWQYRELVCPEKYVGCATCAWILWTHFIMLACAHTEHVRASKPCKGFGPLLCHGCSAHNESGSLSPFKEKVKRKHNLVFFFTWMVI